MFEQSYWNTVSTHPPCQPAAHGVGPPPRLPLRAQAGGTSPAPIKIILYNIIDETFSLKKVINSLRGTYLVERPARDCSEPKLAEGVGDVQDLKENHSSSGPTYLRFITVRHVAAEFSDSEVKTSSGWRRLLLGAASATSSC